MSIEKIAELAQVSIATVSRAFNSPNKVSDKTRERVLQKAKEIGYISNASARALRTNKTNVIGVMVPTMLNPVYAEYCEGITQSAFEAGYSTMILNSAYHLEQEKIVLQKLLEANVDGLILTVSNTQNPQAMSFVKALRIPYVLAYNNDPHYPCVSVDSRQALTELVASLTNAGHQHITMVCGELTVSDRAQQRYQGYLDAVQHSPGLQPNLLEIPFIESANAQIQQYLMEHSHITALVCSNDLLAIRCLRAAQQLGRKIPDELSIIGFDGIALGRELYPMLSSIETPNKQIGQTSFSLLYQAMLNDTALSPLDTCLLPYSFQQGESCNIAFINLPHRS